MLTLYNTLSRKKELFTPFSKNKVNLYVCGITPYDTTHLGHAFTYISFDLLVRYLKFLGFSVSYTQNVTDINDRDNDILKRAKEKNIYWKDLVKFWTDKFLDDMKTLNWVVPSKYLKASEQIPAMVSIIEKIITNDLAYVVAGGVYLDTQKINDFGKLSRFSKDKMLTFAKDFEEDLDNPNKKTPLDITLWKPSAKNLPAHIPEFNSPWGKGRPGWHIECSSMAITSLSDQIDIHGGGIDLIYPHHESEIAQSEAATNKIPFAKYWMHTGTVSINGEKMSKSLGNLILISDLLKKYNPNAIRWVLLSHHYRKGWSYKEKEFINAEKMIVFIKSVINSHPKNRLCHPELVSGSSQEIEKIPDPDFAEGYGRARQVRNDKSMNGDEIKIKSNYLDTAKDYLDDDLNAPDLLKYTLTELKKAETSKNEVLKNHIREVLLMLGFVF